MSEIRLLEGQRSALEKQIREGQSLRAYTDALAVGPLEDWAWGEDRAVASRLLRDLGAPRQASAFRLRNYRRCPESPQASLHYGYEILARKGPLPTIKFVDERLSERHPWPDTTIADLIALKAFGLALLKDFTRAWPLLDQADTLAPDRLWLLHERSEMLELEDRIDEALATARQTLAINPIYRAGIRQVAELLYLANEDDEAITLLRSAYDRSDDRYVVSQLADFHSEREEYQAALEILSDYERRTPLAEKHVSKWLQAERARLHYLLGDVEKTISFGKDCDNTFFVDVAKKLESHPHLERRRVRLAVPFIRQHDLTCAPATLTAICQFWQCEVAHLDVVEAICYDGTPDHSERQWALDHGFIARDFKVTWTNLQALIDRGVPFTLGTVEPENAHLQAVIGYDAWAGTLLIRDPNDRHYREYLADTFLEKYAFSGPRGMILIPEAKAALLDGLELDEAPLYDHVFTLNRALNRHDRAAAERSLEDLVSEAPGHRLTCVAERALARYDGNSRRGLECLERWLALFPDQPALKLWRFHYLDAHVARQERLAVIEAEMGKEEAPSVFKREYACLLSADATRHRDSLKLFRELMPIRRNDDGLYMEYAALLWQTDKATALPYYRAASCLNRKSEFNAFNYFKAARHLRQTDEALEYLEQRMEHFGSQDSGPAETLYEAKESLHFGSGLPVLEAALLRRPNDGPFHLYAAREFRTHGEPARAEALLHQATGHCSPVALARAQAEMAEFRGNPDRALELWGQVLETEPLDTRANRQRTQLLAIRQGREAAIAHLRSLSERFPTHGAVQELYLEWLKREGDDAAEPVIRHLLDIDPLNHWARRELVLNLTAQSKLDEALAEAEILLQRDPTESYSHSIAGHIRLRRGETQDALDSFRRAVTLNVDNGSALEALVFQTVGAEAKRAALDEIFEQLRDQVIFDDAIPSYRSAAYPVLEPMDLLGKLREIHQHRPDLWQSSSSLLAQEIAMGDLDAALETSTQMTERFPLVPGTWLQRGRVHERRAEFDLAITAYEKAIELNPQWTAGSRRLANVYETTHQLDKAREVLERTVNREPETASHHGVLAQILWKLQERDAAFETLKRAVRTDPDYSWAWNALARWGKVLKRTDEAIEEAKTLTDLRPREAVCWESLARVYETLERPLDQIAALDRGIAVQPRLSYLYDEKAYVLADLGRYDEALAVCEWQQWEGIPRRNLRARAAWIEMRRGRRLAAIEQMEAVMKEDASYQWGAEMLSRWHVDEGQLEDALVWAEHYVRLAPETAEAHGYHGHVLKQLERFDEASHCFRKAFDLDVDYSYAGRQLLLLQLKSGQREAALSTAEKVASLQSPRVVGEMFEEVEDHEGAVMFYERAIAAEPDVAMNYGYLADYLWKCEEKERAWDCLAKGLAREESYDWGWEQLATWSQELGTEDAAIAVARQIIAEAPEKGSAWSNLALVYQTLDRADDEMKALDEGLVVVPESVELRDRKAWRLADDHQPVLAIDVCLIGPWGDELAPHRLRGRAAWVHAMQGNRSEAIKLMKSAVASEPDYLWGLKQLCEWLTEEEQWDEALTYCHELIRVDQGNAVSFGFRADLHLKREDEASAEDDLQRAFQLDCSYRYASRELLRLLLTREAFDEAERAVLRLEKDYPHETTLLRRIELEAARGSKDTAFVALKTLCQSNETETWVIDTAITAITEAGWGSPASLEAFFSEVLQSTKTREELPPGVASHWVHQHTLQGKWKVHKDLATWPMPSAVTRAAWLRYLEDAYDHKWKRHLWRAIRRYKERFHQDDRLWGQVGYYLTDDGQFRKASKWLADWRQRGEVEGWMMLNMATALECSRGINASADVRAHALTELPWDHTTSRHVVALAFQALAKDDQATACALLDRVIESELTPYYRCIQELTLSVIDGRAGNVDQAASRWHQAIKERPAWIEDRSLRSFFWVYRRLAQPFFKGTRYRFLLWKAAGSVAYHHVFS